MANQVLLASVWYIASCWMMHSGMMKQVRRLIRNFLWGGSDGTTDTRARVRWSTIILPREDGGLGIIDPEMQCKALLTKFIVRGLFPGNETWKLMLRSVLDTVTLRPMRGGQSWRPDVRYIFTTAPLSVSHLSPFIRSLLRTWISMRQGLIRRTPNCEEEIARQPLIWNSMVVDGEGRQLGQRTHIDWAAWDCDPAASMRSWAATRQVPADIVAETHSIGRGVHARITEFLHSGTE